MEGITDEQRKEYRLDEGLDPEKHKVMSERWMRKLDEDGKMLPEYKKMYDVWTRQQIEALLEEDDYEEIKRVKELYAKRPKQLEREYKRICKAAMKRKGAEQRKERKKERHALEELAHEYVRGELALKPSHAEEEETSSEPPSEEEKEDEAEEEK